MGPSSGRRERGDRSPRRPHAWRLPVGALLTGLLLAGLLLFPVLLSQGRVSLTMNLSDDLIFDWGTARSPGSFTADPGENVTLRLVNTGAIPHTFTLFAEPNAQLPLTDNEALQELYLRSVPIRDIRLEGRQEMTINFTAPTREALYTFVCIEPFHAVGGMHGSIAVGVAPGAGGILSGIGIVQGLILIAIAGTVVFAILYQIRATRP